MPGESILVVNAGSSSVKFQVFSILTDKGLSPFLKGQIDGIGTRPHLRATADSDSVTVDQVFDLDKVPDVATAMQVAGAWIREKFDLQFAAVGHRVVHGGPQYDRPVLVDETVLAELTRLGPLAPLHQPNNLAPINALRARFPDLPQVACFDTAFHRGHSAVADHFAIPQRFYAEGVRRYGFHGLSYEYVAGRLREIAPDVAKGRVIVAHLGSGASMCALANGRSIESTMGFTALDGLPMGTRPGQLDPGVVLYLLNEKGMSANAVQSMLYSECGLKGLSGISNDVRDLMNSTAPGAALAMDYFIYRVSLHAGMLAAALGGLDAFVFTAGIGEKSSIVRQRISERLSWLGAELDSAANDAGAPVISQAKSRVALMIVPTDEELMIARHTLAALSSDRAHDPTFKKIA
jgi:acetate kinase